MYVGTSGPAASSLFQPHPQVFIARDSERPLGLESEEAGPERDRGLPQGAQLLD